MKIRLLAVGTKLPNWVTEGFNEYIKRLPQSFSLELCEIPAEKRPTNPSKISDALIKQIKEKEGFRILSKVNANHKLIALDVLGKPWSTETLSKNLNEFKQEGQNIDLIVGGPDGLSMECLNKANLKWSLSPLTLPHPLVRIVIAEQIYRAHSILTNHPYHR